MRSRSPNQTESKDLFLEEGGLDLRMAEETWCKLAESEARLHLMVELMDLQVGFQDVEQFCLELESKYRSTATGELKDKGVNSPE